MTRDPATIREVSAMRVAVLTPIQRRVLRYFAEYTLLRGVPPAIHEVRDAFGWTSNNAAVGHFTALIRKGYLIHEPGVAHAYRLAGVRCVIDENEAAGRRLREAIDGDTQTD